MLVLLMFMMVFSVMNCSIDSADAGQELVIIKQPIFFGSGGVHPVSFPAGDTQWYALTSYAEFFNVYPQEYKETFTDLITQDNNPVDFDVYIELQIQKGKSAELVENFGKDWYKQKIAKKGREFVRNFGRGQTMFDLTTNEIIALEMQQVAFDGLVNHIATEGVPIDVNRVSVGKVTPPQAVIDETIKTAAQKQRFMTEEAGAQAELAREDRETNKAIADKAYRDEFGMSNAQYIELRGLEIQREIVEMAKEKDNVDLLINVGNREIQPMYQK